MGDKGFKLGQILRYRAEVERVRTQEFVVARRSFEQADERLKREQASLLDYKRHYRERQHEFESIDEITMYSHFLQWKEAHVEQQKWQVHELDQELGRKRASLIDATKDKKVLESLKEKKAREFKLLMDQKEQLFMDEISVQKRSKAS